MRRCLGLHLTAAEQPLFNDCFIDIIDSICVLFLDIMTCVKEHGIKYHKLITLKITHDNK